MPTLSRKQLITLTLLTLVWGLNWPVMKLGVQHFPPLAFRASSMLIGLPLLATLLVVLKTPFKVERRYWGRLLVLGLFNMVLWHTLIIIAIPCCRGAEYRQCGRGGFPCRCFSATRSSTSGGSHGCQRVGAASKVRRQTKRRGIDSTTLAFPRPIAAKVKTSASRLGDRRANREARHRTSCEHRLSSQGQLAFSLQRSMGKA